MQELVVAGLLEIYSVLGFPAALHTNLGKHLKNQIGW